MLPALMLILAGAVAGTPPAVPDPKIAVVKDRECEKGANDIVVCAQRPQPYRLDPNVTDANREMESNSRSASSVVPAAQANCSTSPMGCGKGLEGLDLANVAVVTGTLAVRAAKGEDWLSVFRAGGADEYQLYQQAKQRREAQAAERAAAALQLKAREAERQAEADSGSR